MLTEMDLFFMLTLPPWKIVATVSCLLILARGPGRATSLAHADELNLEPKLSCLCSPFVLPAVPEANEHFESRTVSRQNGAGFV
jgi:hypothetical protein